VREISRTGAVLVRPDGFIGFRSIEAVEDPVTVLASAFDAILSVYIGPGASAAG
jgi:2,4-dichlorophenol 6-monooxygenase